jgi:hypothetical protein
VIFWPILSGLSTGLAYFQVSKALLPENRPGLWIGQTRWVKRSHSGHQRNFRWTLDENFPCCGHSQSPHTNITQFTSPQPKYRNSLSPQTTISQFIFTTSTAVFGGSLARKLRFHRFNVQFWRKSRTKASFWQLQLAVLEEVSRATCFWETADSRHSMFCKTKRASKYGWCLNA